MSRIYKTKSGDKWDGIAYTQMGDTRYTHLLIEANPGLCTVFIFPAGVELVIPDTPAMTSSDLPPWRTRT